jgi:hypothetical protein
MATVSLNQIPGSQKIHVPKMDSLAKKDADINIENAMRQKDLRENKGKRDISKYYQP